MGENNPLLALPEDAFKDIVDMDLKGTADEVTHQQLRAPEVVERWYSALLSTKQSVESQLIARKADADTARIQYEQAVANAKRVGNDSLIEALKRRHLDREQQNSRWLSGVTRFKAGLDETLIEAEYLLAQKRETSSYGLVTRLTQAIKAHRDHQCDVDPRCTDDYCAADDDLWSLVDNDVEVPLAG